MEIQLSISVLISDRPKTVSKCLDSLCPILQELPSELIAVYTGKENESLEIVKKYTNNIIPFEWCDDFSKARNVGLKASKGQWFMYIDDDEWFEDCSEIIDFFKSGEYLNYNSANYNVRNYIDLSGKKYTNSVAFRMIKREKNTEFKGAVHEIFNECKNPLKYFNCFVHHYGYAKGNKDRNIDCSERNIPLLLKQLEQEPEEVRHMVQLAQEYHRIGELCNAELQCRKVLELDEGAFATYFVQWTATFLIRILWENKEKHNTLVEGKQLLDTGKLTELYKMELYTYLVTECFEDKEYELGVTYGMDFIALRDRLNKNPMEWEHQQVLTVNKTNVLKKSNYVYSNAILCAIISQDFGSFTHILKEFNWDDIGEQEKIYEFWDKGKRFFDIYKKEFLYAFSMLDSDNSYVLFQKALYYEMNQEHDKTKEMYLQCQKNLKFFLSPQLILMAIRNNFALPNFMDVFDLDDWRNCAQSVAENFDVENRLEEMTRIEAIFYQYPLQRKILLQKILARVLYDNSINSEDFINILNRYCSAVLELNQFLYRAELFEPSMQFCLPKECRMALEIQCILQLLNQNKVEDCIKLTKDMIYQQPSLSYIAGRIADYIEEQQKDIQIKANKKEFNEIGTKAKEIMKSFAENEQYKEALAIVEELCVLLPDDQEVIKYKQLLTKLLAEH